MPCSAPSVWEVFFEMGFISGSMLQSVFRSSGQRPDQGLPWSGIASGIGVHKASRCLLFVEGRRPLKNMPKNQIQCLVGRLMERTGFNPFGFLCMKHRLELGCVAHLQGFIHRKVHLIGSAFKPLSRAIDAFHWFGLGVLRAPVSPKKGPPVVRIGGSQVQCRSVLARRQRPYDEAGKGLIRWRGIGQPLTGALIGLTADQGSNELPRVVPMMLKPLGKPEKQFWMGWGIGSMHLVDRLNQSSSHELLPDPVDGRACKITTLCIGQSLLNEQFTTTGAWKRRWFLFLFELLQAFFFLLPALIVQTDQQGFFNGRSIKKLQTRLGVSPACSYKSLLPHFVQLQIRHCRK